MALDGGKPEAAELVAAECVVLAETKDHLNWELIGEREESEGREGLGAEGSPQGGRRRGGRAPVPHHWLDPGAVDRGPGHAGCPAAARGGEGREDGDRRCPGEARAQGPAVGPPWPRTARHSEAGSAPNFTRSARRPETYPTVSSGAPATQAARGGLARARAGSRDARPRGVTGPCESPPCSLPHCCCSPGRRASTGSGQGRRPPPRRDQEAQTPQAGPPAPGPEQRSDRFDPDRAEPSSSALETQPEKGQATGFDFYRDPLERRRSRCRPSRRS